MAKFEGKSIINFAWKFSVLEEGTDASGQLSELFVLLRQVLGNVI